jgi:N utilization substance protein B
MSVGGRRKARELVLQACYAYELSGNPVEQAMEMIILACDETPPTIKFAAELFQKTVSKLQEFDEMIKKWAANWEFDRIAIIDKILLRIAICEFLYFEDIPPKVSIDEAIEIAKLYSTENSGRFVNGILDAILNDLEKKGDVQKKGRGLDNG